MSYHALLAAPPLPTLVQPALRAGAERCSLEPGVHGLGGPAADAIALTPLARQPRAAILMVSGDGTTTLQRTTASVMVRIDGKTIGIAAVVLHHGATIEFGDCRLVYECESAPRSTPEPAESPAVAADVTPRARPLALVMDGGRAGDTRPAPHASTHARAAGRAEDRVPSAALVVARSGIRHPLPERRIYIGRDDGCDIVVRGSSVSRRHASIAPVVGGFMLRDESANGTLVNGVRVVGTYLLGHGDVVRIQDDELRVELDASAPRPVVREEQATMLDLAQIAPGVTEQRAREVAKRVPTASLEIVRGRFAGACFQIERAVCSLGRGEDNDVRIRDDTVSLTHATLLRKRGAWFVVDLRSMNGTYVDGSRVSGERELHPGARLRLGGVELAFRAIEVEERPPVEPPRPGVWSRVRDLLGIFAPPGARRPH
ncbi:MAG TPA: FHA domain-containing protein [Gemmatimonadaceae bacterium]|jgi:pSer/pThr/pTyr-binding forkhead associated (FHA) protein|nr:FHA domain-containing protein [Gemmatimonadaceae bacterium]